MPRQQTSRGGLIRMGFRATDTAEPLLRRLGPSVDPLLAILARTADPDAALARLAQLVEAVDKDDPGSGAHLLRELADDEGTAMRLLAVLGASQALGEHLVRHPEQWSQLTDPLLGSTRPAAYALRADLLRAVGADPRPGPAAADAPQPRATLPDADAVDALRVEYRRILLRLAARDLTHHLGVDDAAAELADLAAGTLEAALAVARARVADAGDDPDVVRLAVVAMGKCGGHELNYVSDVDVLFVHAPAPGVAEDDPRVLRTATRLAAAMMQVCSADTAEGTIWPVDANLRPEGSQGPLTRTLASHQGYYEKWAKTWEFQALLKARAVAGDLALGERFTAMVAPMVWRVADRDGFVTDTQAMRRRVVAHIPADQVERQLKLGPGGLRDVEFAVQLLQLVHGRADEGIRSPTTLSALWDLTEQGYVGREDGRALHEAYAFLRQLEHRMQLHQLRRTHVVPDDTEALRRLGRSLGFLSDPVEQLGKTLRHHRREVRRLHEKLFYRPLLDAVAQLPGGEARLSAEAARTRLAALGYVDPPAALRHLEALTTGVSRAASIQRTLLPVMLAWFAEGHDPDAGLFGFRRLSESMGDTPWYLRLLRDEGEVARRVARVLSSSRYATDLLLREPHGVRILAGDLQPHSAEELTAEMLASARRQTGAPAAVRVVRGIRRRELFRIAAGELLGVLDVDTVGAALSRLTDATLEAALDVAVRTVTRARGLDAPPTRMAVVAMGRYGGFELSYGSDADVMFVHDPLPEPGAEPGAKVGADRAQQAASFAQAVVTELRTQLAAAGPDPALEIDADLRPEGKQGPLVRTLSSYAAYYAKWSHVWEAQALLRADAVVGDEDLRVAFTALIDPLRYPVGGLGDDDVLEVRRIKARVDRERLPRGADPQTHLKLGRGGLADIEWTVQLLQMQHAGAVPGLRTQRTLEALDHALDAGLVTPDDAADLALAWRMVSRVRNAVTLVQGHQGDHLPRGARDRAAVAEILGYPDGSSDEMVNDYLRTTRHAHQVVDRVFWG